MSLLYQWVIETMEKTGSEWVGVRREPFNSAKVALNALQLVAKDPHWNYRLVLCRYDVNGLGLIVRESHAAAYEYTLPSVFMDAQGFVDDLVPSKYKKELETAYSELYPITYDALTANELKWRWPGFKRVLEVVFIYQLLMVILTSQMPSMAQFIFDSALAALVTLFVLPGVSFFCGWLKSKCSG
ncbi:TPA: hypothetical protein ACSCYS_004298 [Aeromonas veronii]